MLRQGAFSILLSFLLIACGASQSIEGPETTNLNEDVLALEEITLNGAGSVGIFDPSVAREDDQSPIYMAYSSVEIPTSGTDNFAVSTQLAKSTDEGKTWSKVADIVSAPEVTTTFSGVEKGIWGHETSNLFYDSTATDPNKRWVLIGVRLLTLRRGFNGGDGREFAHSWISLRQAATAEGLASAPETKWFAGSLLSSLSDTAGGSTQTPVAGPAAIQISNAILPQLNSFPGTVIAEPSLMIQNGKVHLALQVVTPPPFFSKKIHILRCDTTPCDYTNSAAWSYVGNAFQSETGINLIGSGNRAAPELVSQNGKVFVIVTGTTDTPWASYYAGCKVYKYEDFSNLTLSLEPTLANGIEVGKNAVASLSLRVDDNFHGACSYMPGLSGGMLVSRFFHDASNVNQSRFKIYKTNIFKVFDQ